MIRQITSYGYIWFDKDKKQVACQVGHHWNGVFETLSFKEKRILRKLTK